MEHNPRVMQERQTQQPKILIASAENFTSTSSGNKSPMMFDSWTQTTNEDIPLQDQKPQSPLENYLFQKLQETLRKQVDFISQIQELHQPQQQLQPQPLQMPQQIQQPQQNLQQQQQQLRLQQPREQHQMPQYQVHTITSATTSPQLSAPRNLHTSSGIYAGVQDASTGTIKYTIIAEADGEANVEPIEIELTEGNSSTESIGSMDICLADEDINDLKEVSMPKNIMPSQSAMSMKQPSSCRFNSENSNECSSSALVSSTRVIEHPNFAATTANGRGRGRGLGRARGITRNTANYKTKKQLAVLPSESKSSDALVSIGPNNTCIPVSIHEQIKWESASISTRQLLCAVYGREKLSTHTMTGKKSPAFNDKPRKNALDPLPIEDIIFAVTNKCNVSKKVVRNSITTKCADENKMMKAKLKQMQLINDQQMQLINEQQNANKEN